MHRSGSASSGLALLHHYPFTSGLDSLLKTSLPCSLTYTSRRSAIDDFMLALYSPCLNMGTRPSSSSLASTTPSSGGWNRSRTNSVMTQALHISAFAVAWLVGSANAVSGLHRGGTSASRWAAAKAPWLVMVATLRAASSLDKEKEEIENGCSFPCRDPCLYILRYMRVAPYKRSCYMA